ncbi:hypothetical protein M0H32_20750 [Roseibium sp. CAU 1639]|uniref:Uncharacterized protein n=1 Tax=Roseibium sediminicola TaxID=2933272 RepID=A0ABT0GYT0_9HYPH|nr:hypothetical protein [Roseibium sp. CAU 1639]MCK7614604.1 hypothetical protein [Roseibium sp. CAU 1639]
MSYRGTEIDVVKDNTVPPICAPHFGRIQKLMDVQIVLPVTVLPGR